jgi:hypothetical protein
MEELCEALARALPYVTAAANYDEQIGKPTHKCEAQRVEQEIKRLLHEYEVEY